MSEKHWKHYTREQQLELLQDALGRLQLDFDVPLALTAKLADCLGSCVRTAEKIPLALTAKLADCLGSCVRTVEKKLRPEGSAPTIEYTDVRHLKNLRRIVQDLTDVVPPLVGAIEVSNPEYFVEPDPEAKEQARKSRVERLAVERMREELKKIGQGMFEPSETGDAVVEVPPPEEPDIPF